MNLSLFQNLPEGFNDSREDLLASDDKLYYSSNPALVVPGSNTNLSTTNTANKWITSSESLLNNNQIDSRTSLQTSAIDLNLPGNQMGSSQWNPVGSNASLINRAQSSSCLDLANSNLNINKERLKSLLPTYRPAPSYEAAIQQKIRGSQPEVGQSMYENFAHQQNQMPIYPDVTQNTGNLMGPHYSDASDYGLPHRFKMMAVKNPPQYTANRLSSTSTPDLALASHRGLFGYRTSGSSPDLVSSRTLLQHGLIPSSILYPYTSVSSAAGMKQRLRHSHSFLPHATYENLNFIETANPNMFPAKHIPNNLIYRTASAAAAQQMADMEYYLHKQQRNHSLNALNLSNSHISEPIYENFPMPSYEARPKDNERRMPIEKRALLLPRPNQSEQSMVTVPTNLINNYNNSNRNVNELLNGNDNSKHKQQHYLIVKSDINNGNTMSGSASKINMSHEKDVNLNNIPSSASVSNLYHNQQIKQRQQHQSNTLNTSGTSSISTVNTTDTTDSGISTGMNRKKEKGEKRNKIWNILSGGGKNKQKSATLGREKDKNKKEKTPEVTKEVDSNLKHRWSTGLPRLQPLPSNISKEKLCQLLEAKLNDSQLFLEFERIPKRKENAQYSCAIHDENRNKNSDRTLLPMDENRVKLTPTRENRMGYVNASHISVSSCRTLCKETFSFSFYTQSTVGHKQRFYIAAQSPIDSLTADIFWQCVWEADVYLLIQLSDDFCYVPTNSERCLEYGQVRKFECFRND